MGSDGPGDVHAALLLTMDDDELSAHVGELRGLLRTTPRDDPGNDDLLIAFGAACRELGARGLPYAPLGDEGADVVALRPEPACTVCGGSGFNVDFASTNDSPVVGPCPACQGRRR